MYLTPSGLARTAWQQHEADEARHAAERDRRANAATKVTLIERCGAECSDGFFAGGVQCGHCDLYGDGWMRSEVTALQALVEADADYPDELEDEAVAAVVAAGHDAELTHAAVCRAVAKAVQLALLTEKHGAEEAQHIANVCRALLAVQVPA